jgi:DNA uptake protein ComE-like DNA-binding protein
MKTFIKDFLTYSRREKRGVVILIVIFIITLVFRLYVPQISATETTADFSIFENEIDEFKAALQRAGDSIDSVKKQQSLINSKRYPQYLHSSSGNHKQISPSDTMIIDLNDCDTLDLQILRGIGPYFARNIVNYRRLLGGYVSKTQLLEVYGMDSAKYAGISDRIRISQGGIEKLDLNSDHYKTFLRHPYFEFYLVKEIFRYRGKHGFDSVSQVLELEVVNQNLFRKIEPYLTVE